MDSAIEEVPLGINKGDTFLTYEDAENKVNSFAQRNFVQFYKREARTIKAGARKTNRYLNPALTFYQVEWACVHGGRQFKTQSKGIRKSNTLKYEKPCPAQIRIRVSPSGNDFEVITVQNNHNHQVCKSLFDELPQQRKLPAEIKKDTKKLLDMKVNRHMLRDELERKLDKKITLKDLTNLQSENKVQYNNDIKEACEKINSKFGADCHILVDNNNLFKGMMFCTGAMKSAMGAYPEFLCMDGTYKLLNIRAPVYLLLIVNGNGESIVVAVGILTTEDKESIIWFLENFKQENPQWIRTKTIMTDKDLVERDVILQCFPNARLQICIFHALKIFQTEITCDNFKITASDKHTILEHLQKLVYCRNDSEFFKIVDTMEKKIPRRVFQYLEKNWLTIKEQWYLGAQHNNFLNVTNNRLESINAKLKQVISKHSSIGEFLERLFTILKSLQNEQDSRLANLLNKRSTTLYKTNTLEYKYQTILTPYGFKKMMTQFMYESVKVAANDGAYICSNSSTQSSSVSYCTTVNKCTCYFHVSMGLPCKHIFAVRHYLNEELFEENLIPERWRIKYLLGNNSLFTNNYSNDFNEPTTSTVNVMNERPKKILSQQEKYRILITKCKMAASLGVEAHGSNFTKVTELFDQIVEMLQYNTYDFKFTYASKNSEKNMNNSNCGNAPEQFDSIVDEVFIHSEEGAHVGIDEDVNYNIAESSKNNEVYCDVSNLSAIVEDTVNNSISSVDNLCLSNNETDCDAYENLDCDKIIIINDLLYEETDQNDNGNRSNVHKSDAIICDKPYNPNSENHTDICDNNRNPATSPCNDFTLSNGNSNKIGSAIKKDSNQADIENIIVIPAKVKGRPKGRDATVIGLPKKQSKEKKFFKNKTANEKRTLILSWLLSNADQVKYKKNITLSDLKSVEDIDIRILEINLSIIKKFIPPELWQTVKDLKQRKQKLAIWSCLLCNKIILSKEPTIRCDACLCWFHTTCSNYSAADTSQIWCCSNCI